MTEDLDQVTEVTEADVNRWSEDGHKVLFKWERDVISVEEVACPHSGTNAPCTAGRDQCAVRTFLMIFGAELNVGEAILDGPVEIAWTPERGESDLDPEYACIWVTPVNDINYRAMKLALQTL